MFWLTKCGDSISSYRNCQEWFISYSTHIHTTHTHIHTRKSRLIVPDINLDDFLFIQPLLINGGNVTILSGLFPTATKSSYNLSLTFHRHIIFVKSNNIPQSRNFILLFFFSSFPTHKSVCDCWKLQFLGHCTQMSRHHHCLCGLLRSACQIEGFYHFWSAHAIFWDAAFISLAKKTR